jgi:hypothetical protein
VKRFRRFVTKAFRVLGERDFALLWGGQTTSIIGDGVFTVAIGMRTTILVGGLIGCLMALVVFLPGTRDPDCGRVSAATASYEFADEAALADG